MSDRIESVTKLLKVAFSLEFKTGPGRFNWGSMVLVFVLVMLVCVTSIFSQLLEALFPLVDNVDPNYPQITMVGGGLFVACMAVLLVEEHILPKKRDGELAPKRRSDEIDPHSDDENDAE